MTQQHDDTNRMAEQVLNLDPAAIGSDLAMSSADALKETELARNANIQEAKMALDQVLRHFKTVSGVKKHLQAAREELQTKVLARNPYTDPQNWVVENASLKVFDYFMMAINSSIDTATTIDKRTINGRN